MVKTKILFYWSLVIKIFFYCLYCNKLQKHLYIFIVSFGIACCLIVKIEWHVILADLNDFRHLVNGEILTGLVKMFLILFTEIFQWELWQDTCRWCDFYMSHIIFADKAYVSCYLMENLLLAWVKYSVWIFSSGHVFYTKN